jgi:hypothetical protein
MLSPSVALLLALLDPYDGNHPALASPGDLDGDGVPDFLVGATGETDMPVRAYGGRDGKPLFVLRPGERSTGRTSARPARTSGRGARHARARRRGCAG